MALRLLVEPARLTGVVRHAEAPPPGSSGRIPPDTKIRIKNSDDSTFLAERTEAPREPIELGLNPAKLGKIDNHHQEPWKAPLADFIFGRLRPEKVLSIEDIARERARKEQARGEAKAQRRLARAAEQNPAVGDGIGDEEKAT